MKTIIFPRDRTLESRAYMCRLRVRTSCDGAVFRIRSSPYVRRNPVSSVGIQRGGRLRFASPHCCHLSLQDFSAYRLSTQCSPGDNGIEVETRRLQAELNAALVSLKAARDDLRAERDRCVEEEQSSRSLWVSVRSWGRTSGECKPTQYLSGCAREQMLRA